MYTQPILYPSKICIAIMSVHVDTTTALTTQDQKTGESGMPKKMQGDLKKAVDKAQVDDADPLSFYTIFKEQVKQPDQSGNSLPIQKAI
jgi:hypothetical protein